MPNFLRRRWKMPPPRQIMVVPSDCYANGFVTAPCGTFDLTDGLDHYATWGSRFNAWAKRRIPWQTTALLSKYPSAQMRRPDSPTELSASFVLSQVVAEWPVLMEERASKKYLHSFLVITGDGYAGGRNLKSFGIYGGDCIIGDTELFQLTGIVHPAATHDHYKDGRSDSHEKIHMLGAYCHAGDCFNDGEFPVSGAHECIDPGYTTYPLQFWTDDQGTPLPFDPNDHHLVMETKLYSGQEAQFDKYSSRWFR